MEDPQHFSYVTARAKHHKEGASGQNNVLDKTRREQQQGVQG